MQLEAVRRVSVGDLSLQVGGQIDDVDCIEGAFFGTDTTSNTQALRYESNLGHRVDLYTQLASTHNWT